MPDLAPMRVLIVLLLAIAVSLTGCGIKRSKVYLWPPTEVSDTPN
jgi:hypothetical protein